MSENAVNKRGIVQKELRQAIEVLETISPDNIYLIPVRLDECLSQRAPRPHEEPCQRVPTFPG